MSVCTRLWTRVCTHCTVYEDQSGAITWLRGPGSTPVGGASEGAGEVDARVALGWGWPRAEVGTHEPHSAPPGRPRAAEAQRGRDPNGGLCPLAWVGQPRASRSSSACLINGGGVGPFSQTCPSPARACLLSRWTPPSHFLPPPPTGHCPNIWSGFPVSRGAGAGSQGGNCGTVWEWPWDCENRRAGGGVQPG